MAETSGSQRTGIALASMQFLKSFSEAPSDQVKEALRSYYPLSQHQIEWVLGQKAKSAGLLFRNSKKAFTAAVLSGLKENGIDPEICSSYQSLAEFFEHQGAFLKLEWQASQTGNPPPLKMVAYFHRRPQVSTVLKYLESCGFEPAPLKSIARISALLEKQSVHFLALSIEPGKAAGFKIYFSQYLKPGHHENVFQRFLHLAEQPGIHSRARDLWAATHPKLIQKEEASTLFASFSIQTDQLLPTVKFDYPKVRAEIALGLLEEEKQAPALREMQDLCALAGTDRLDYLGIRLSGKEHLELKYYADFQGD